MNPGGRQAAAIRFADAGAALKAVACRMPAGWALRQAVATANRMKDQLMRQ